MESGGEVVVRIIESKKRKKASDRVRRIKMEI